MLLFEMQYTLQRQWCNIYISAHDSLKGSGPIHLVGSHCVEKFAEEIEDEGEEEEEEELGEEATDDKAECK